MSENEEHCKNENECQICTVNQKMMNMAKPTISQVFVLMDRCWRFSNQIHGAGSAMRRHDTVQKLFTESQSKKGAFDSV